MVVLDPTAGCNSALPEPSTGSPTVLYYSSYLRFTLAKRFLYLSRSHRVTAHSYRAADYVSSAVGSLPIKHLFYVKKKSFKTVVMTVITARRPEPANFASVLAP